MPNTQSKFNVSNTGAGIIESIDKDFTAKLTQICEFRSLQTKCKAVVAARDQFSNKHIVALAEQISKEQYDLVLENVAMYNTFIDYTENFASLIESLSEVDSFTYEMIQGK